MKKVGSIGLVFVFLLIASNALADSFAGSVTITTTLANAVYYQYTDINSVFHQDLVTPYSANIVIGSSSYTGYVTCLDKDANVSSGPVYAGTWYTQSSWPGTAAQLTQYKEASYLVNTYLTGMTPAIANAQFSANNYTVGDTQLAIWYIMSGSGGSVTYDSITHTYTASGGNTPLTTAAEAMIYAAENSTNVAGNLVFVPDPSNPTQRFMLDPSSPVPIPPAIFLLAPGLLGLGVLRKRYKS